MAFKSVGALLLLAWAVSACGGETAAPVSTPAPAAARTTRQQVRSTNKVLILANSVAGGLNSPEAQAVKAYAPAAQIDVKTAAEWTALSAEQFMSYQTLIIGDAACQGDTSAFQAAIDNRATWGAIVDGDVVIIASDPSTNGQVDLLNSGVHFALNTVQYLTGMYISLGCAYQSAPANTAVTLLEPFGTFKVQGLPACADSGHIFRMSNDIISKDMWDGLLVGNDGCSTSTVFTAYPDHTFSYVALAQNSSGEPIPGQQVYDDLDFGQPFAGTPYIVVRGAMPIGAGCGDSQPGSGEECDLGDGINGQPSYILNPPPGNTCSWSCHLNWCGDGVVDTAFGEECDLGANNGRSQDISGSINQNCTSFCKVPHIPSANHPPVAVCQDMTVTATNQCGMTASINNGSYDVDGDLVGCTQSPAGPYNIGPNQLVTLTCTDQRGNSAQCSAKVTVLDGVAPVVTLTAPVNQSLECTKGGTYTDPGYSANDMCSGPLPQSSITKTGAVNMGAPGSYTLGYYATDSVGNKSATVTRTVTVADTLAPVILAPVAPPVECGSSYTDPVVTANDQCEGDVSSKIARTGTVNTAVVGDYSLKYTVSDTAGHPAQASRTVSVRDTTKPTVVLNAPVSQTVECGGTYTDPGASASDLCAGALSTSVNTSTVNMAVPGSYVINYKATDPSGNVGVSSDRSVTVQDSLLPTLTLNGSTNVGLECATTFTDPGATANDQCYGNLTNSIVRTGTVDNKQLGTSQVLTYNVTDPKGNAATPVTRTVKVSDTQAPVITVNGPLSDSFECGSTYVDPGATGNDACAGSVPVTSTQMGDPSQPGTITYTYSATDPSGNSVTSPVTRSVKVNDDAPPMLALVGPSIQNIECADPYTDPDATANDACFGDLTSSIVRTGSVNNKAPASYQLTYNVSDPAGNAAPAVNRTVKVSDTLAPSITVLGSLTQSVQCGSGPYADQGATASDACAGDLTSAIVKTGSVNSSAAGSYTIKYSVSDPSGNSVTSSDVRSVTVVDDLPPTISLNGSASSTLECGTPYSDPGATANDACAGDLTAQISKTGSVNEKVPATYALHYSVTDPSNHTASVDRSVKVQDTLAPALALNGAVSQTVECGSSYLDPGATATDVCAGNLDAAIIVSGAVNPRALGNYTVTYNVSDTAGNAAPTVTRAVKVNDTLAPSITVNGPIDQQFECGSAYVDPGATANDQCAGDLTSAIVATRSGNTNQQGQFTITYSVQDPSGNSVTSPVVRTVHVNDNAAPTLTLNGSALMNLECGTAFVDPGATATDACAGDLSAAIVMTGTVNPRVPGTYTASYDVADPSGNEAPSASRTVTVVDDQPPEITCPGPTVVEIFDGEEATVTLDPAQATDTCDPEVRISSPTQTRFPVGTTTLTYTATDASGNTATCSTTVTVLSDGPPDTLIVSGPPNQTEDTHATFVFNATKPEVTYECSLDGADFTPCPATTELTGLAEGKHSLQVRARDSAGQLDPTPAAACWTVLPPAPIEGMDRDFLGGGRGCSSTEGGPSSLAMLGLGLFVALRARRRTGARLLALATLLLEARAFAQTQPVPTFELELLKLNPSGAGSLVLGTGELLPEGGYRLSLSTHYEKDPLVLFQDGARLGAVVRHRATAQLAAAYGLWGRVELGAQVPVLLLQRGDDLTAQGVAPPQGGPGLGTPLLTLRLKLLAEREQDPADLSLGVEAGPALGRGVALARELRATPSLMLGRRLGFLRGAIDAGILLRSHTILSPDANVHDEIGHALRLGAALSTIGEGLRGELAVIASVPLTRQGSSVETLVGARMPWGDSLEAYGLAGLGSGNAPGTPDFRVLLGVAYGRAHPACVTGGKHEPRSCPELDDDGDGVKNRDDLCPRELGSVDNQGCPLKDTDSDGIADGVDRCPAAPGLPALHGCPDQDGDGVEDVADQCPMEPGPAALLGCPAKDSDSDGIVDGEDVCPTEAGIPEMHGCPAKDTDNDSVLDHLDNCPEVPGPVENHGCPAEDKQLVVIQKGRIEIQDTVHFDFDRATIQPRSFPLLDQVAQVLVEHPEILSVTIEGHTDDRGSAEYNRDLSQRRAESVREYLAQKGVARERMQAQGFGEDRPVQTNTTEEGRAANRRVEFITHYIQKTAP